MKKTCSTSLVRCMDFRLDSAIRDYMEKHGLYDDADIIAVAGAAKNLAQKENSTVEQQIQLSKKLHDVHTIILINHTDCGGYGGRAAFASAEEEKQTHITDLHTAKQKLLNMYPDITVITLLADIHDDETVEITEIE